MILAFADPVVAVDSNSIWIIIAPSLGALLIAVAALITAVATWITNQSQNKKLARVVHQTDGRVSKQDAEIKSLNESLTEARHNLALMLGQEKERVEQTAKFAAIKAAAVEIPRT